MDVAMPVRPLAVAALVVAAAVAPARAAGPLPFIKDDWPRALALAKESRRPLFVEAWAPW
jgi:hypothetical protein